MSDLEFRVERTFDQPIERVWAAYTDPALIPRVTSPAPTRHPEITADPHRVGRVVSSNQPERDHQISQRGNLQ